MKIFCERCKKESEQYKSYKKLCRECVVRKTFEKRRRTKQLAVNYKGGSCEICGYNKCLEALDFHHIDPCTKDGNIANLLTKCLSIDRLKNELDKCQLLCRNCHAEAHNRFDGYSFSEEELTGNGRQRGTIRKVKITCGYCTREFEVDYRLRNSRKFCNLKCSSLNQRKVARVAY